MITAESLGLERSCADDWVHAGTSRRGFERIEARFRTHAFVRGSSGKRSSGIKSWIVTTTGGVDRLTRALSGTRTQTQGEGLRNE